MRITDGVKTAAGCRRLAGFMTVSSVRLVCGAAVHKFLSVS